MKVTITLIELKSPLKFFALSRYALNILRQLKKTNYAGFKKRGIWTTHYTMTLWNSEEDLKAFAASGAHLTSMQQGARIAKEIRTATIEADELPDWKTAKRILQEKGKSLKY